MTMSKAQLDMTTRPMPQGPMQTLLMSTPLFLLELALLVCWSSGFVGTRYAINYGPIFLVVFWRCLLLTLVLLPWVWKELCCSSARVLLRQACIGLLAMSAYLAGVGKGIELGVPTGLAALMADLLPVVTALISMIFLGYRLRAKAVMGLLLGLAGVCVLTWGSLRWGVAVWWAYLLPFLGMLALAVAGIWQQSVAATKTPSVLLILWLQCAVSVLCFGVLAYYEGGVIPTANWEFWYAVLWTAGLSTVGGYGLYWLCLRRSSATRVATVLYLSPALTLVWAHWMFAEPLNYSMVLGALLSLLGVGVFIRAQPVNEEIKIKV